MAVALTALFVSLGGTGYAATQLGHSPAAAVAKKKKKPPAHPDSSADKKLFNSLFSALIPNAHVAFATSAGSASTATTAASATHASNADNATHATSADNATSAAKATEADNAAKLGGVAPSGYQTSALASGKTEIGGYSTWGATGGYLGTSVTFQIPLPTTLDEHHVHFIVSGATPTTECPGTSASPAAAKGNLCVYETSSGNSHMEKIFPNSTGAGTGADSFGFDIYFATTGTGGAWNYGTWAVTA